MKTTRTTTPNVTPKCESRDRPVHAAGSQPKDCLECAATLCSWRPPVWQLVTRVGIFDYDERPKNPLVRFLIWRRGWSWRKNPALVARGNPEAGDFHADSVAAMKKAP